MLDLWILRAQYQEKEFFVVFMKGDCEDAVGGPEGLFDTVAVMDVDIDVENPRMVAEELEDGKNDVINVTEATCFCLFGVMKSSRPIDRDVALLGYQLAGCVH